MNAHIASEAPSSAPASVTINRISRDDVMTALKLGLRDFWQTPTHLYFLGLIYPVMMVIGVWAALDYNMWALVFPLISGGALLGPFAAIAIYRISRRQERGDPVSAWDAVSLLDTPHASWIISLGLALVAVFVLWLLAALAIYQATLGGQGLAGMDFLRAVFFTPQGLALILTGNAAGLIFAALVFSANVVSFPMILDRGVYPWQAVATSFRVVARNPGPMMFWAAIIALSLAATALTFFVGLALVLPVLGHASWRLYRMTVA